VFYEMLAGKRPTLGGGEIQPPRQFVDSIPRELERICLKALSAQMADRYTTGNDFAAELEAWLKDSAGHGNHARDLAQEHDSRTESSLRWQKYGHLPDGPSLAVLPFNSIGDDDDTRSLASGLTEEINSQLTKFKDLFILGRRVTDKYKSDQRDASAIGQELGVDYLLLGSVRRSTDQLRVTARLVASSTGQNLWSETFRGNLSTQDVFEIEDEIATCVTVTLGLHDGVIAQSRLRTTNAVTDDIDAYDCVTRFYQYLSSPRPHLQQTQIRQELEATVHQHPDYASARAALATVYLNGYLMNLVERETRDELLAMAESAAVEAAKVAPANSLALEILFRCEFHCGNHEAFTDGVERAISANPNNANMLANAAICLGCLGKLDRSLLLARKAITLSPNPPGWYYTPEYWQGLISEDYETALIFAKRYGVASYWGPAIRAVSLGHLNRVDEARQEWEYLFEINPRFMEDFAWEMKAWHINEALQHASVAGLVKAGLIPAPEQVE